MLRPRGNPISKRRDRPRACSRLAFGVSARSRFAVSVFACTALILAGCTGAASTSTPDTSNGATPARGDFAGLVDIGGGRTMYLQCQGTGSPTVVLVSGRADRGDIWQTLADPNQPGPAVLPGVATSTRVCAYDRPGTVTITGEHVEASRSTPVPEPTTADDGVRDLHELLTAAKLPGSGPRPLAVPLDASGRRSPCDIRPST